MKACAACGETRCDADWRCLGCDFRPSEIGGFRAFAGELGSAATGFDPAHFATLASVEADNFWFLARNELIRWATRTYFPGSRAVHEVGCGTGFVMGALQDALPGSHVSGSDIFVEGLAFAAERIPGADLYQMDARRMPFRDEFDLIGAFDVIEHIEDDRAALRSIHTALRSNGGLLLTVPQHPALWSEQDLKAHHQRRYVSSALQAALEATGFRVLRMTSFVTFLLPAMLIARRRRAVERDGAETLSVSRPLDLALRRVMALERRFITAGMSFPAGGSLLVAARKAT